MSTVARGDGETGGVASGKAPSRKAPPTRWLLPSLVGGVALLGTVFLLAVPEWAFPPIVSQEHGPAALEMVTFTDPRRVQPLNYVPEPLPAAASGGPMARDVYQNVQVLTGLSQAEFDRLMVAMTQWVSPKQGCAYCHDPQGGYASEALPAFKVSRQQIRMTVAMNTDWGNHLAPSGVTCHTCHRGEPVPPRVWYRQPEPHHAGLLGKPRPWHIDAPTIRQFFPSKPFEEWALDKDSAHLQSEAALPGEPGSGVAKEQKAEDLYLYMMQMSDALGVNCGYCHNSRAFFDWKQSTPNRLVAWWAMGQTADLNKTWIEPLADLLPKERLGLLGDAGKVECGTCHIGNQKPLGGFGLLAHYPALGPQGGVTAGDDQHIRDLARPLEVQGPAYDPTARTVAVDVPAYPPPDKWIDPVPNPKR